MDAKWQLWFLALYHSLLIITFTAISSVICVPIILVNNEILGVIEFFRKTENSPYSELDLRNVMVCQQKLYKYSNIIVTFKLSWFWLLEV